VNAQVSVIEPEALEYLPAKTMLRLVEQAQKVKKYTALFQATLGGHAELFRNLEELDLDAAFCLRSGDIDLSFTGDGQRLLTVWKELRRAGWAPNTHPKKGETTFSTHWLKEGNATFWMHFSSTVCRRVQTGTKTVEVPVYETQCGDLPEVDALAASANALVEVDSGVPF
jgi:hypothetical protein